MAKKSHRRPSRQREHPGCIWGLINIFDLRHGRSTKRLLSDRKRVNKQAVGAEPSKIEAIQPGPTNICENEVDSEESKYEVAKISVKELMEEEMCNEETSLINNSNDFDGTCSEQIDSKHERKNHKRKKRTSSKSKDMDVSDTDAATFFKPENFQKGPEKRTSDNLDWETILEQLAPVNERNLNSTAVDEKLVAAVKLVIEQRISHGQNFDDDEKPCCSKELADALQTLSSNKGLFLKLLKDPNSVIVKHMQNLEDAGLEKVQPQNCLPESNWSQDNSRADETSRRKHHNFFRRRSKSMESFPVAKDKDSQSSGKIVVLKPGPAAAWSPRSPRADIAFSSISLHPDDMDNEVQNVRNMSHFSFSEIKRKLRNAMGKERQGVSPDRLRHKNNFDKGENLGWSSPNRNHFYTEKFAKSSIKKAEADGKLKGDSPGHGPSDIYIEAKKHLSEILNNGEEKAESMNIQLPKPLGRILSLPEYNGSPCCSPRKQGDGVFVTSQMRSSPRGTVKNSDSEILLENQNSCPNPSEQNLDSQPRISCSNSEDKVQSPEINDNVLPQHNQECSFSENIIVHDGQDSASRVVEIEEETDLRSLEEERVLDNCTESSSTSVTGDIRVEGNGGASESTDGCVKMDLSGDNQTSLSPAVSPACSSVDKTDRPSPVSVLEPLFTDDEISPANRTSLSVDKEIQPRHIHFEEQSSAVDQGICTRISLEDEESAFEYVEAVLLGSGLNWDDFLLRWLSFSEILDSSLFEEVELFSSRSRDDQKLLFDSANEALKEICETYFGFFTSSVEQKMRPIPKGMDLIHEVWRHVELHLLQYTRPHSLDLLVKRDMERSRKWMNLRNDFEDLSFEMVDEIFDEMVEDTVLSFVEDISYCGDFEDLQDDPIAIEETNM